MSHNNSSPLKMVAKRINKKLIIEKVKLINDFYKIKLKKKPKIALLGLNLIVKVFLN